MATLKEEEAFAFALETQMLDYACSYCFMNDVPLFKCKACLMVSYCNRGCQTSDWADHKNECRLLQQSKITFYGAPDMYVRLATRILFMSEEKLAQKAFNGRSWNSLTDHVEDIENAPDSPLKRHFFEKVAILMKFLAPLKKFSSDVLVKTMSKILTNGYSGCDKQSSSINIGFCIFLGLSVHNHSCQPDCVWITVGTKSTLRSFKANAVYSPELTVCYIRVLPFTEFHCFRQKTLKDHYFFDCKCSLCADKNHIINRMAESCHVACCHEGAGILDEQSNGPYKCNKCGTISPITKEQIEEIHSKIDYFIKVGRNFELADAPSALPKAVDLLNENKEVLSMYNYRMVDLCNLIINWASRVNDSIALQLEELMHCAYEYYLPEDHPERISHEITLSILKTQLGKPDAVDSVKKALRAAVRCYGRTHHMSLKLKQQYDDGLNRLTRQMKNMKGLGGRR